MTGFDGAEAQSDFHHCRLSVCRYCSCRSCRNFSPVSGQASGLAVAVQQTSHDGIPDGWQVIGRPAHGTGVGYRCCGNRSASTKDVGLVVRGGAVLGQWLWRFGELLRDRRCAQKHFWCRYLFGFPLCTQSPASQVLFQKAFYLVVKLTEILERETGIEPATNSLEDFPWFENKEHMRQWR